MAELTEAQRRVLEGLREPRRAQDLATALGIDASAVRRHLDNLVAQGLVQTRDVRGGPGRPKRFYELTPEGRERGPRNYALLLALFMQKVSEGEGRKQLLRYLEGIAADLAGPAPRQRDARMRLDLLLAKYNSLGFQATVEKDGKDLVLVQRNCPFLASATADPEAFCHHLDEGAIRKAMPGHTVELRSSIAKGDATCRHVLRKAEAEPTP